jgi:hypothetical protein
MYRAEVPQGSLSQQNFSHLARLVKYIEPRTRSALAFAIGNLSRDDTQYEPGHGAVALIFGLRIQGATDHAGRRDPAFCHAIAAIDRHLDAATLFETAMAFQQKIQPGEDSHAQKSAWYHEYVRPDQSVESRRSILESYVAELDELPAPGPSGLGSHWTSEGVVMPGRIVIVYADEESFEAIAACAARIAEVLVESDIRWTAISTGREQDVPGGVSIRFVPEQDAGTEAADVPVYRIEDVPTDPREIAEQLFGASAVRASQMSELRMGWQQRFGNSGGEAEARRESDGGPPVSVRVPSLRPAAIGSASEDVSVEVGEDGSEKLPKRESGSGPGAAATRGAGDAGPKAGAAAGRSESKAERGGRKKSGNQIGLLIGIALVLAVGGAVAAVVIGTKDPGKEVNQGSAPELANSADSGGEKVSPPPLVIEPQPTSASPTGTATDPASSAGPVATAIEMPSAAGKTRKPPASTKKKPSSVFVVP